LAAQHAFSSDALQQRVVGKSGSAFRRQRPDQLDRLLRGGRSCEQLAELRHRLELPDGPLPGDLERVILVLARRADRFAPVPDLPSTEPNPNAEADQEQASDGDGDGDHDGLRSGACEGVGSAWYSSKSVCPPMDDATLRSRTAS
jgi:hypothetical protein